MNPVWIELVSFGVSDGSEGGRFFCLSMHALLLSFVFRLGV